MIKHTGGDNLPKIIKSWVLNDEYDGYSPDPNTISATSLIKKPKKAILSDHVAQSKDIVVEVDINSLLASKSGTAVHDSIELYARRKLEENPELNLIVEERHKRKIEVDGETYTISAKFDCVEDNEMMDWKNTSPFTHGDLVKYEEWKLQLSICRWAAEPKLGELKPHGTIVALFKQWSKAMADKKAPFDYPENAIQPYTFELYTYEETEQWVIDRIRERNELKDVETANDVVCTPEDLWTKGGTYKYFSKPENTRATKNSDNLAELQALVRAKGGVIKEPEPKACAYCYGSAVCKQYAGFVAKGLINADRF